MYIFVFDGTFGENGGLMGVDGDGVCKILGEKF